MKSHKIRVTTAQIDRLFADLDALAAEPAGAHLADDERIGYVMEQLTAEQTKRVESHLNSCQDCALQMARLFEASEAWLGESGARRLAALRDRMQERLSSPSPLPLWERLAASLRHLAVAPNVSLAPVGALAAASVAWQEGSTPDGALHWALDEEENGDLVVRLGSRQPELAGMTLHLQADDWRQAVVLRLVEAGQVGAEVRLTGEERMRLPPDTPLTIAGP